MIISALPSPASTTETGTHRMSTVTGEIADSGSIEVDGEVATDDAGNPLAFVNVPDGSVSAEATGVTDETSVDIDLADASTTDVTVFAVVE